MHATTGQRTAPSGTALLVLLIGQAMANIDLAIVNLAAPAVSADLHVSSSELTLMVTAYALCSAVLLAPAARLGERQGVRRVYLLGLALFTLASLGCGLAQDTAMLIVGRCLQGAATALMTSQVLVGIHRWFTGPTRARALGWNAVTLSGGAALGQVLGGTIVSADLLGTGWRAVFLLNVPIGAVVLALGAALLPHDRPAAADIRRGDNDVPGTVLLAAATLAVLVPLSVEKPDWIWVLLIAAVPLAVQLARTERRVIAGGGTPALDLRPLSAPAVRWALASFAGTTLTYLAMLYLLSLYLQDHLHLPAWQAGLVPLGWVLAFGAAGPVIGRAPQRVARLLPFAGCAMLTAAYALAPVVPAGGGGAIWPLTAVLCIGGFGLGLTHTALLNLLTTAVPSRFAATLSGTVNTLSTVVGVIGVALFGAVYPWLVDAHWAGAATAWALSCTGLALVAAVCGLAALRAVAASGPAEAEPAPEMVDAAIATGAAVPVFTTEEHPGPSATP
ncbi:MFS transporter [Kitasatospora sp. SolWspMP-SS2h]|uniref:MFS transporter n=1 Tax=Kitasatospora sp. SolWspMP-SS2h TaxID=1305729 RepID=UPI000DB95486|nr:MFS transporter [Kitasatospora sp. SolWspMP-SS2h]RAJ38351.1 MFS transporter [Kitasatospora sp. SolWspMP-SS2h]